MIVIPGIVLKTLMQSIVESTHSLSDEGGASAIQGTIDEKALRMAAITAVQIATGQAVWPGDQTIQIPDQPRQHGIFRFAR